MRNAQNAQSIESRVREGLPLDHIPVIDFHAHITGSSEYYYLPKSSPADIVAKMDRYGIAHVVSFPICTSSDVRTGSRAQYELARAYPDRFSVLPMLHARFPQDWIGILEEAHQAGCHGIKLISHYQGVEERGIDWSPALEFARDKRWVVLNHAWSGEDRLERWAKEFPEVIFIEGHANLQYKKILETYPNVYQSTCACFVQCFCPTAQEMIDKLPVDKILYGSDALDLEFGTAQEHPPRAPGVGGNQNKNPRRQCPEDHETVRLAYTWEVTRLGVEILVLDYLCVTI